MSSGRRRFDYPWSSGEWESEAEDFSHWASDMWDVMIRDGVGSDEQYFCAEWDKLPLEMKAKMYASEVSCLQWDRSERKG